MSGVLAVRSTLLRVWPGFPVRWFSFFAVRLFSVSFGLQWPFVILHPSFYGSKNNRINQPLWTDRRSAKVFQTRSLAQEVAEMLEGHGIHVVCETVEVESVGGSWG